jgi:HlyD family secretion protein
VAPRDIDHVHLGQLAFVRFTAFNVRTTPEFEGDVVRISADVALDQQANQAYFIVRIAIRDADNLAAHKMKLVPGMPAEIYIKTADRTALSYLMKPLTDQIAKAFIER